MISQTVEYALRAIVTIAQHEGKPCTAREISEITHVPAAYLSKLMQGLVRGGLVNSQRGLHGGFVLTTHPEQLTIWDIINVVEPIQRIRECPLGIQSHGANLCPLHRRLDKAMETIEEMFKKTTVAEVLAQSGSVTPLCEAQKVYSLETDSNRLNPRRKTKSS